MTDFVFDSARCEGRTKGPWRLNKYGSIGAGETGIQPIVAHVEPLYGSDLKHGDDSANARLIADAPMLLREVERLREALEPFTAFFEGGLSQQTEKWPGRKDPSHIIYGWNGQYLTSGIFFRARAALSEQEDG